MNFFLNKLIIKKRLNNENIVLLFFSFCSNANLLKFFTNFCVKNFENNKINNFSIDIFFIKSSFFYLIISLIKLFENAFLIKLNKIFII